MGADEAVNVAVVVIGVGVFILAGFVAYEAHICVQQHGGTLAEFGRAIDPGLEAEYEECLMRRFWGVIGAFIGALVAFAGVVRD